MFGKIGPMELGLILGVILLLFGAKRLPELGSSLGKGIRDFKKSLSSADDDPGEPTQLLKRDDQERLT